MHVVCERALLAIIQGFPHVLLNIGIDWSAPVLFETEQLKGVPNFSPRELLSPSNRGDLIDIFKSSKGWLGPTPFAPEN